MREYCRFDGKSIRMVGCDKVIFHLFSNDTTTIRFATDTPSAEGNHG
jgi:hypothetical protein